jgi:uncharacterized coiled-coil DUF342 family protein
LEFETERQDSKREIEKLTTEAAKSKVELQKLKEERDKLKEETIDLKGQLGESFLELERLREELQSKPDQSSYLFLPYFLLL